MRKTIFTSAAFCLFQFACIKLCAVSGENLFFNPAVDKPFSGDFRSLSQQECTEVTQFTEQGSWNKCARLEIKKYIISGQHKKVNGRMVIGGDARQYGFEVSPDKIYHFSLSVKGKGTRVFIGACSWKEGAKFWEVGKVQFLQKTGMMKIPEEWRTVRGAFKVAPGIRRAALTVTFWGDSAADDLSEKIGDYVLVDNIRITERSVTGTDLLSGPAPGRSPSDEKTADRKALFADGSANSNFMLRYSGKKPLAETSFSVLREKDGLLLRVRNANPPVVKAPLAEAGKKESDPEKIWKDDLMEIFFDCVKNDRRYTQIVVTAGGALWIGDGVKTVSPEQKEKIRLKTDRNANTWNAEIFIPFDFLGFEAPPSAERHILFNIVRQNRSTKEFSSWSKVERVFNDKKRFGVLFPGTFRDGKQAMLKKYGKKVQTLPVKHADEAKGLLRDMKTAADGSMLFASAERMDKLLRIAAFEGRKFFVTQLPHGTSMSVPMIPENLSSERGAIRLRAARNEQVSCAIALTNMTNRFEEYRVILFQEEDNGQEIEGIRGIAPENIALLRGIRVKDSENPDPDRRFDPLVELDASRTVGAPARDSALLWLKINTRDLKKGIYKSRLRVIPLGEKARMTRDSQTKQWTIQGDVLDTDVELEVLDFSLSAVPPLERFVWRDPLNETFFAHMLSEDVFHYQISPWKFNFRFAPDGSRLDSGEEIRAERQLENYLRWARKYGVEKKISFVLVYSAYQAFRDTAPQFREGTEQWRRALSSWSRGIEEVFSRHGIPPDRYLVEIEDEPAARKIPESKLLEICGIIKKAAPRLRLMFTMDSYFRPELYPSLERYTDVYCVWSGLFHAPRSRRYFERLRSMGKKIWIYQCEVGINADLSRYYRQHAWLGFRNRVDVLSIYHYVPGIHGEYGSTTWKCLLDGALVYRSGAECLTSIRNENLLLGITDLRYHRALGDAIAEARKRNADSPVLLRAEKLHKDAPQLILETNAHDGNYPDTLRNEMAERILEIKALH